MPRKRQESYEERRRQIVAGALEVFSHRGFTAATNQEIAAAAGINSPGLIYHYFANKEDLLRAVIESYAPPLQLLSRGEALMELPPEEALPQFGQAYLRLMEDPQIGGCIRVLAREALRFPHFAETLRAAGPGRFLELLARYLERKMDEGVLRRESPAAAARCFLGPLMAYVLARHILSVPDEPELDGHALLDLQVRIFLGGLKADPAPHTAVDAGSNPSVPPPGGGL